MSNRKDRREQERQNRKPGATDPGSSYTAAFGPALPTAAADFARGAQFPHGFMVADPTGDGAPVMPLPIILLNQKCMQQAVGLQRLFDVHLKIGTVALNQQMVGQHGWAFQGDPMSPEKSLLKFKLRLEAPHPVHTDLLLIANNFHVQIRKAATADMMGLMSPREVERLQTDPPADFAGIMDRCVLVATPRSMVLQNALLVMGL